jgi:DNA polymerase III subunit epsilon
MNNPIPDEWFKLGPFTIFDIETTGLSPVYHRIVELAAVRIDKDGGQTRFSSLVNPGCKIPMRLVSIHGITDEMVKDAEKFKDVGYKFLDFCKDSTLVAHNARFDLSFLQESFARTGLKVWNGKTLDTIPLIKQAYPGLNSYSLQNLLVTFGLDSTIGPAHRAFADVEWTLDIFKRTMKRLLGAYI